MSMHVYGLRAAKRIVLEMRAEMAADPLMRRSQDPYVRGQRAALNELARRIDAELSQKVMS